MENSIIPIARPVLDNEEAEAAREVILSGWVTQGPKIAQFETAFAEFVGSSHACAVSSCTAALHLALLAVGVKPGDVVITVSHSFIATANAVRYCQAEPVFIDVDPLTLNMSHIDLKRCLSEDFREHDGHLWYQNSNRLAVGESPFVGRTGPLGRLAAILVVHQVGMPANLDRLLAIARASGVPVIEDAACAIGSEVLLDGSSTWERIGKPHADIVCFSFHPRKVITTGDGGMLTTSNPEYDQRCRLLRQHGMSVSDVQRHASKAVIFEEYVTTSFNYRMTDIQGAIGLVQLMRLPGLLDERRKLAERYRELLMGVDRVQVFEEPGYARSNWQSYVVRLDTELDQKTVMEEMLARGVSTRRGVMCAHLELPYQKAWPLGTLPESEKSQKQCVVLPLFPGMTENELGRIVDSLSAVCHQAKR
jgi:dTDP-4-amino-4,6-dideoxygalactose transaminase